MLISFIIPAYNCELYIKRCFDSCYSGMSNSYDKEIIIIDDGSKDRTGIICEEIAKSKDNVFVIHKKNEGLSQARNDGIKQARGDYILFLDSDDTINEKELCRLVENCKDSKPDVILFRGNRIVRKNDKDEIKGIYKKDIDFLGVITSGKDILINELEHDCFSAMAQMGLYKKEFITYNNLFFKPGIIHEDEEWNPRMLLKAKSAYVSDIIIYNYYSTEGSITHRPNPQRYHDLLDTIDELREIYNDDEELKIYGNRYLCKLYMKAVANLYVLGEHMLIDWGFIKQNTHGIKDLIKIIMFGISKTSYKKMVE